MMLKLFLVIALGIGTNAIPLIEHKNQMIPRESTTFIHPGVFVNQAQLAFVKSKISASAAPWAAAYKDMQTYDMAKTTWEPNPVSIVRCLDTGGAADIGCEDERMDALAAYSMALLWAYAGDKKYAEKAISIFDAWSEVIKQHTGENAPLQTGWAGSVWARAAEIIRHTNAGWSSSSIAAFEDMLRNVYMPLVKDGSSENENNWDLGKLPPIAIEEV